MKTQMRQVGETLIIEISGKLDFEADQPFKHELEKITRRCSRSTSKNTSDSTPRFIKQSRTNSGNPRFTTTTTSVVENQTSPISEIIFDLEKLDFVGSCGITNFLQTLAEFNGKSAIKPKYNHMKNEFKRMIKAFDVSFGSDFENETHLNTPALKIEINQ